MAARGGASNDLTYQNYDGELNEIKTVIRDRLRLIQESKTEERRADLDKANEELTTAEEVLGQMDLIAAGDPKKQQKVEMHRREIKEISISLKKLESAVKYDIEHSSLLGSANIRDLQVTSKDHQDKMSDVTRKYADANPVIEQAIQDAERTVTTLSGAMEDLDKQRETILHSLRRLGDVNGSLAKGFRTMRMMARKAIANKLLMGSIAAALVLTILFILFMKFVKPLIGGGDDPSSSGSSVSSFLYNTTTSSNLS